MITSSLRKATIDEYIVKNIRASQKARKKVKDLSSRVRQAERNYINQELGLNSDKEFYEVPNEIKEKIVSLMPVVDDNHPEPREIDTISDVNGDAVGSITRVEDQIFYTPLHVIETLCDDPAQIYYSLGGDKVFCAQIGGTETFCSVLSFKTELDQARVYAHRPLLGPVYQIGSFDPNSEVTIPYRIKGTAAVYTTVMSPIEGIYGFATIYNPPFKPGASGLPVLHRGVAIGMFVGMQRSNGIVTLFDAPGESFKSLSDVIGHIELYGKKKKRLSHFIRSGKISQADYADRVRGLTLKLGRPPNKYELEEEIDLFTAYHDEESEEDEYDDYDYEEYEKYNPFDDEDDREYFIENIRAQAKKARRDEQVRGVPVPLHLEYYAKKKKSVENPDLTTPLLIVNPHTEIEVVIDKQVDPEVKDDPFSWLLQNEVSTEKGNPFDDLLISAELPLETPVQVGPVEPPPLPTPIENVDIAPARLASQPAVKESLKKMVSHPFDAETDDEVSVMKGEIVAILEEFDDGWTSIRTQNGSIGLIPSSHLKPLVERRRPPPAPKEEPIKAEKQLLLQANTEGVKAQLQSYAAAVKAGDMIGTLKNLPSAKQLSAARMSLEIEELNKEIKTLKDSGIFSRDPVILTEHELEKYPANEHLKQQLLKELKVLKSIKNVRDRRDAEREAHRKKAERLQATLNSKTAECAMLKDALAEALKKATGEDF